MKRIVQNSNNLIRVLKCVKLHNGISRIEISKRIKLDKSTVTVMVNKLLDSGLIETCDERNSNHQGGRKPIGLRIKEGLGVILGLEIQTDCYYACFIDITGKIYNQFTGKNPDKDTFFQSFLEIYKELYPQIEASPLPLLGIGIGTSGLIDPHKGIILRSNPMDIHSPEDFYQEIRAFINVPVFIENDANCGCWAELFQGTTERQRDFLYVLGEFRQSEVHHRGSYLLAFGLGMVVGERVHYGRDYASGEYRSTRWQSPNLSQFSLSNKELQDIKSDSEILTGIKDELCKDLALIVNVMNLTQVTFGGDLASYTKILEPTLQQAISDNWSYPTKTSIEINGSTLGEYTISFGAAAMLVENLFLTYENPKENPWKQHVGIELFNKLCNIISIGK